MPRGNYESTREVAEALAHALKEGGYRRRQRAFVATREPDKGSSGRVHWVFVLERAEDAESRRKVMEILLSGATLPELSHIVWCSNCNEYWFEHRRKSERFHLGSLGVYLCGDVHKISIPYPQRGLTLAQLGEREDELSASRLNAADIGQRMFYKTAVTQYDLRSYECWETYGGEAALSSVDGAPFTWGQGNWPPILYELERAIEAQRRASKRSGSAGPPLGA